MPVVGIAPAAVNPNASTVVYIPMPVNRPISIDKAWINVTGAGGSGAMYLGIYDANADMTPKSLLQQLGQFDMASATGQAITFTAYPLAAGGPTMYWLALSFPATVAALTGISAGANPYVGSTVTTPSGTAGVSAYQQNGFSAGSLPATPTLSTIVAVAPRVMLHVV